MKIPYLIDDARDVDSFNFISHLFIYKTKLKEIQQSNKQKNQTKYTEFLFFANTYETSVCYLKLCMFGSFFACLFFHLHFLSLVICKLRDEKN